ncbi:MAG TPA: TonB-dependent receptor [Candidatus Kapabacteria bacterium]|nr:TonB-dependent receptor [Candidatus Kapabacteria bacterium]
MKLIRPTRPATLALLVLTMLLASSMYTLAQAPRGGAGGPGGPGGAQGAGATISGIVVDSATAEPLRVATVAIFSERDSTMITGALTERDGRFSIVGLRPGRYYARVSFLGYAHRFIEGIEIAPGGDGARLGSIALVTDAVKGNEVSVTARRDFMTVEIDRTSYKASEMPVAAGGNATDILRNIPSIEVDVDGNVSLRGSQNVVVLLNGRTLSMSGEALTSFLQNLPANSIDRIEVIPNPSAKYDPEGMSGIINIVLKEQASRGLSGGANAGVGTRDSYSAGVNLAYGDGPWNLYGNYGFNASSRTFTGTRDQVNRVAGLAPRLDQSSNDSHSWLGHLVNGSVEYLFDQQNSLALNAIVNLRSSESGGISRYAEMNGQGEIAERYHRLNDGEGDGISTDTRLSYRWVAEPSKHELTAEARLVFGEDDDTTHYAQQQLELDGSPTGVAPAQQRVRQDNDNRGATVQLDYVRPLGDGIRLETGYKGELEGVGGTLYSESFDETTSSFRPDVALNNSYDYERQNHAIYGIYGHDFGLVGVQVGARLEQATSTFDLTTTGESFDNDYFSVFPSAFVTFKPSDALNLKASYSRRINRPWIQALNPFVSQDDPTFRETGNPYLKPEYIDAVELSFNHFTDLTSLTLTPYYRRTTDVIRRYGDLDSTTGVGTVTFLNFDESTSYGADIVGSLRLGERYSMFASASLYQMTTDASNVEDGLASDAFGWNARVNANVGLLEGMDMQLTWFYRSPWALEGGGEVRAMQSSDIAVTQKLLENRLRIGLRLSDVFDQRQFSVTRNDAQYDISFTRKPSSRIAMLTLSYTFGTPDRKARRPQQTQPQGPDMEGGW